MLDRSRRIIGTKERPRLQVSVSLKNVYAQIIDDIRGVTLAAASTVDKELKDKKDLLSNIASAAKIGELIGKRAAAKGIKAVVFDRGKKRYHGKVKAVADSARAAGLSF